ncbi:MAG: hypothetical protein ACI9BW_002990 [Gammaproteobacteria bacterium]|jgi:hypothetical protein
MNDYGTWTRVVKLGARTVLVTPLVEVIQFGQGGDLDAAAAPFAALELNKIPTRPVIMRRIET